MHLLLSVFATEWSFSRFLRDKNKKYAYHIPCLLFLSASLMWFVDSIFEYLEKGTEIFTPNLQDLVQDGFLGLSVIALGILIWQGKLFLAYLQKQKSSVPNSVGHFLRTVHTCYPFLFSAPAFALV